MSGRLGRRFFGRPAVEVARDLVGKRLVHRTPQGTTAGIIVESEAYSGINDPASHAYQSRRTNRNETLWGPPGHAYVYRIYGRYLCLNVVCGEVGDPQGAFVRAVRPTLGVDLMAARRHITVSDEKDRRRLCRGPSLLCIAFAITKEHNGADLTKEDLYLTEGDMSPEVWTAPRVGVSYAGAASGWPWRFVLDHDPYVSRPVPSPTVRDQWR